MRPLSRWRVWLAVVPLVLSFWAQDGAAAYAATRPSASLGAGLDQVWKWLSGSDGSGPRSKTGSAHDVRTAKAGKGQPSGKAPGKGKGQLAAWKAPRTQAKKERSGSASVGFNAKTSKRVAARSGAQFDYFQNADGSFTRRMSQSRINYRDSSGTWKSIDTTVAKRADGRWHERANSLGVSFAPSTATDGSVRQSALRGSGAGSVVPAALAWKPTSSALQADYADDPTATPSPTVSSGASAQGDLATLTISDSESVSWSLAGANSVTGTASGSGVEYDGVLTDTNLVLASTADGVKESLVLTSANAPTSWVFPMSLKGVTLTTASDGTVELVDGSGTVAATLPQPFARDSYVDPATGESHDNWGMTYSVTEVDGAPAVKMSLDPSWLAGSDIAFPVTVDPTMTVSTAGQTLTTYVYYPNTADYSSDTIMRVGTPDGGAYIGQAFMKFLGLPDTDGYHITAADLHLFDVWAYTCSSSTSYNVMPITQQWWVTGQKSWSDRPATAASIGTWSGTVSGTVCGNTSVSTGTGQWQTTSLDTDYFQKIALGQTSNYGLSVFSSGTSSSQWKKFDSSQVDSHAPYVTVTYSKNSAPDIEHTYPKANFTSPSLRPQLQVKAVDPDSWPTSPLKYDFAVYSSAGKQIDTSGWQSSTKWTVPSGDLGWSTSYYWTVSAYDGWSTTTSSSQPLSTLVAQPLVASRLAQNGGHGYDEEAGNYTTSATDASVSTVGPSLEVTRSYNSLDTSTAGAFGAGWSALADMRAVMDDDGSKSVVVTDDGGKQERWGYSSSGYTSPTGTYGTFKALSSGYSLTETSGTTYTFSTAGGTNMWLLSQIKTHAGLTETLTYDSSYRLSTIKNDVSGRTLYFTWSKPSGAAHYHVHTVTTDAATSGDTSTAALWTYGYTGDQLTAVCPPSTTSPSTASTSCYAYTYIAGSNYSSAALDAGPSGYWRLDESSGSTTAASSVLANEQTDAGSYKNATLGSTTGPLTGSTAKALTLAGTGYAKVPAGLLHASTTRALSLWFKTSKKGVLIGDQSKAVAGTTATGTWTPVLYVGSDGKLHGHWWSVSGSGSADFGSTGTVTDSTWHHAVLSSDGSTQTLYLDGTKQDTFSGTPDDQDNAYTYIGAGFATSWLDSPGDVSYFTGSISDVSFYSHPITASQVDDLYADGTASAALLTKASSPVGRTTAAVAYDTDADRLTQVTDEKGGTWKLGTPSVAGSSAVYRGTVLGADPAGYWQLGDDNTGGAATYAADEVNGGDGTYNNVTLGVSGPFSAKDSTASTAASFDGTSSYVSVPADLLHTDTKRSIGIWFKTTTSGVLIGDQSTAIDGATDASGTWTPVLYVGSDGKLHGHWWSVSGSGSADFGSTGTVTDNAWHYAVLSCDVDSQALFLDGTKQDTFSGTPADQSNSITYIGAGFAKGWIDSPGNVSHFKGSIAEAAFYDHNLTSAQVATQWNAYKQSTGTVATESVAVTDPGNNTLTSTYDLSNGGRMLTDTDGTGATTSYGYDTSGFLHTTTDGNGNVTTTGHNSRGDVVSRTTCQDQSASKCSTSYFTYYLNANSDTDPRNDQLLTSSDGRSSSSSDTTYQTVNTYDTNGNPLTKTAPAVTGHSAGLTTKKTYTSSNTPSWASGIYAPAGLLASTTTPGGAVTSYVYHPNGDLAQETSPLGLVTRYTYDALGRVLTKTEISDTYPAGLVTRYTYDPLGRVLTELDPGTTNAVNQAVVHTALTTKTYDADGNTLTTTVSDTTGGDTARATSTVYNDFGEPKTVTDAEQHSTGFTYDAYGNKQGETDADGQVYAFTHNANGNLLTTTLTNYTGSSATSQTAAAKLLEQRAYDAGGRLYTITDGIGVTTTYGYYDNGLTKQITRTGSSDTAYVDEQDSYDDAGNLTAKTTANGTLSTSYTVDAADRTTATSVDPNTLARTTAYTFDDDSRPLTSTQTDAAGDPAQKWTYTYDAAGDTLSAAQYVSSSLTLTTKATYDERGLKVTSTDAQNNVTAYANDEAGRPTTTTSPAITTTTPGTGATATLYPTTFNGYDTFGDRTAAEDANGHITATAYDRDGRKTGTTLPSYNGTSATTAWTYDASGDVLTETDAKSKTDYAYDQLGDLVQQTNPAISISGTDTRGTITYAYDLAGNRLTETSPYGAVTHHTFDDLGRDSSTWAYVYTSTSAQTKQETDTAYNTAGQVASTTSVSGVTAKYTYDVLGRPHTTADTTGDTTTYSYDLRDDVIKTALPDQTAQTATYDAAGRKTATANLDSGGTVLSSTSATYSDDGELKTVTDARQHTTSYEYDALGDLTKQTEPVTDSASIVTRYGYDAAGHETSYTDGNGDTTYATYNSLGLPASKEVPAVTGYTSDADRTTTYTYDERGRLVTQTDPGGVTLTNTYDALDDLTAQTGTGADATTADRHFTYSLNGHLVASAVGNTSEYYDTNALGDILTTSGQAGSSSFTYNADESPATRTDASGTNTYTYDTDGRLNTDTDASTGTTLTYQYNSLSQPKSATYGSAGDVRNYGYDTLHRLTSDTLTTASGTTVAKVAYDWDKNDNLTTKTTTGVQGASANSYAYDYANRLTSWTSGSTTTGYTYDADGNRLTAGSTTYTYNARDQLTSDGTLNYSYTARGTLSAKGSTAYTFDAYGQQVTAGATAYTYDALGRAITAGSTTLAYSGTDNTVASDGTSTYSRDPSGALTGESSATGTTLAWTDLHTDVIGQFTATGTTLTGSASYDPWGTTTASTLTGSAGYQSEYTDPATGNVNMHARWYSPSTGGFNSADTQNNSPVGDSANANPYTYANGDPLLLIDVTGHDAGAAWSALEGMFGAEGVNLADDWNPVGWATAGGIAVIGLGAAGYEYFQDSHPLTHESGATYTSSAHTASGECVDYWSMACQTRYSRTTSSGGGSGSTCYYCGGGGVSPAEAAAAAARAAAAAAAAEAARRAAIRAHAIKITASIGKAHLTIHSISTAAEPPTVRINIGNSVRNAASAVAAGLTTAAVCVVTGGCSGDDDDQGKKKDSCNTGAGFTNPGIVYLPRHKQAGECVATGAFAQLTQANYTPPPRPKLGFALPGLNSLPALNRSRAHLIGFAMGGSNTDTRNFVPMYQRANQWMYDHAEDPVVEAIKGGGSVYVEAYPIYGNKKSTVPTAVQYFTSGSVQEECVIKNNATAAGSYCQQGMW
ncbi:DNA/RNA non-specific endonuclease [Streptomyces coacervatus]|uniref:LamG-like jellyroll fold domain-containing protein n=2 Tax=Streptomyces coacervatus TaxID=647381 RepID=UPI0023D9AE7F|nr:LamG-like jellyroll fold domain-containing protein [Streptomyces coacervatus]MDF2269320.1 DNA/RNA non-specific endonuclease [Streptomyces coacervatus]